jgi:hypothetical protein
MTSYICDHCGTRVNAPTGAVPAGWYTFNVMMISPVPPTTTPLSEPPIPPTPPPAAESAIMHADKQECADAIVHRTSTPIT